MLDWLYGFQYGDHLVKSVVATNYVKQKLSTLVVAFLTVLIRMHVTTIICWFTSTNIYVDFFIHGAISVLLVLNSNWIYKSLLRYEKEILVFTTHVINNYSPQNYRYWKRIITVGIALYFILILLVVEVTNFMLISYIVQYLLCFFVVEQVEQKKIQKLVTMFKNRSENKTERIIYGKINIVDDYLERLEPEYPEDSAEKIGFVVLDNHYGESFSKIK